MEYLLHILVLVGIYTVLAVSLDLLAGHTGLVSIAHAACYGLGAYTSALLAVHFGAPFLAGVLAGMAVAALVSVVVSLPSLRLHDDYFVIATFGFQMILFSIFNNWMDLTRGPLGPDRGRRQGRREVLLFPFLSGLLDLGRLETDLLGQVFECAG